MTIATRPLLIVALSLVLASCTNYGEKVSKDFVEVYYKDNITKEQAQRTLDLLYPSWNEEGVRKSIQLAKKNDTVYFRMVINQEKAKNIPDETFLALANGISASAFDHAPVNVDMTDEKFNTLRTLHFTRITQEALGEKQTAGNIEVYMQDGIAADLAQDLASFIDKADGNSEDTKSYKLSRGDNGGYVVSMVSSPERAATVPEEEFYAFAALISDNVFSGSPVTLLLTDGQFAAFRSFRHPQ